MPQSRVSTHLGKLREAGVLRDRHEGASTYYAINEATMPEEVRRLWNWSPRPRRAALRADRARCQDVLRAREKPGSWPESVAGQMDRHYSPGRTWEATMLGFLPFIHLGDVLDAGSGDGTIAAVLAPRCRSVTCLDRSDKVLQAARRRLSGLANVAFAPGDLHALPFPDDSFDHVLLLNVLTYTKEPAVVLREAARVLAAGWRSHGQHPGPPQPHGHDRDVRSREPGLPPRCTARLAVSGGRPGRRALRDHLARKAFTPLCRDQCICPQT
jgi:SAM-dependent methyltransferase